MNEQHKILPDNPLAFLLRNRMIKVTPGNNGKDCCAYESGEKCACDECEYFASCKPDIDGQAGIMQKE